jgi:hypothetical protein
MFTGVIASVAVDSALIAAQQAWPGVSPGSWFLRLCLGAFFLVIVTFAAIFLFAIAFVIAYATFFLSAVLFVVAIILTIVTPFRAPVVCDYQIVVMGSRHTIVGIVACECNTAQQTCDSYQQ